MKCYICGSPDNLFLHQRVMLKGGGVTEQRMCRQCNSARCRKYRQTEAGKAAVRRAAAKYEAANPLRRKAWGRAGKRIPMRPCERCGSTVKVHRHHEEVSRPLDVTFLCPAHHKQRHREMKLAGQQIAMAV